MFPCNVQSLQNNGNLSFQIKSEVFLFSIIDYIIFFLRNLNTDDLSKLVCIQKASCASPDKLIDGSDVTADDQMKKATFTCKHSNSDLHAENIPRTNELKATCTSGSSGKMPYWKLDDHELKVLFL